MLMGLLPPAEQLEQSDVWLCQRECVLAVTETRTQGSAGAGGRAADAFRARCLSPTPRNASLDNLNFTLSATETEVRRTWI